MIGNLKNSLWGLATLAAASLVLGLAGCKKEEPKPEPPADSGGPKSTQNNPAGNVAPISPAAGGLSPVVGTESMDGGSGVGTAMKAKAKGIAAGSPSSLNRAGRRDEGDEERGAETGGEGSGG